MGYQTCCRSWAKSKALVAKKHAFLGVETSDTFSAVFGCRVEACLVVSVQQVKVELLLDSYGRRLRREYTSVYLHVCPSTRWAVARRQAGRVSGGHKCASQPPMNGVGCRHCYCRVF